MARKYAKEYWRGMKATICDFCGKQTLVDDEKAMIYGVGIFNGDGYEATTKHEKALKFDADDVCMSCTKRIHQALTALQKELKKGK